jgi:hypothetical protein
MLSNVQNIVDLDMQMVFLFIIFVVCVYFIYKGIQFVMHAVLAGAAAALFPFIANYLLGTSIPINMDTLLAFAVAGVVLFFLANMIKKVYLISKILTWPIRRLLGKSDKKKLREEIIRELKKEKKK